MKRTTLPVTMLLLVFVLALSVGAAGMSRPSQPVLEQNVLLATALNGQAYDVLFNEGVPKLVETDTYLPALNYFGYSRSGQFKAYIALDALDEYAPKHRYPISSSIAAQTGARLVPSGDLYVEEAATGKLSRINPDVHYVISAAWSPANANLIAYTFSSGKNYGIALADISSHTRRILRSSGVLADYLAWDISGETIESYATESQNDEGFLEEVNTTVRELRLPTFVSSKNGPGFRPVDSWRLPEVALVSERLSETEKVSPSFSIRFNKGVTIRGDNLLGFSKLEVLDLVEGTTREVPANVIVGISPQGVVYKAITEKGAEINFLSAEGQVSRLLSPKAVMTFKLPFPSPPFPSVTVTQSGEGYSNACNIFDHTFAKNMAYAYDIFAPLSSPYVLASGSGTVAYLFNEVNCNSYDTGGCSDYSSSCSSNGGWGNVVILQHSDGTYTKYTHLRYHSVLPGFGASVGIGCQIGTQGHTGATFSSSTSNPCGDHLHFQRQTTSDRGGVSTAITFSDTSNPLSCTSFSSGNGGRSCIF